MTLPTAAGCISTFETKFAAALAASSYVQSFLGVANSNDAALRIYYSTFSEPGDLANGGYSRSKREGLRPFVIVYVPDGDVEFEKQAQSSSTQIATLVGSVVAMLERNMPADYKTDPQAADRDMRNSVGQIAKDVLERCTNSPYPCLDHAKVDIIAQFTDLDEIADMGDAQYAQITFSRRPSR